MDTSNTRVHYRHILRYIIYIIISWMISTTGYTGSTGISMNSILYLCTTVALLQCIYSIQGVYEYYYNYIYNILIQYINMCAGILYRTSWFANTTAYYRYYRCVLSLTLVKSTRSPGLYQSSSTLLHGQHTQQRPQQYGRSHRGYE